MLPYLLVGLAAVVLALPARLLLLFTYRKWFRQGFAGDAAFHLAVVRELKRDPRFAGVPYFLIKDEPDTYPILFHRFAALFPLSLIERYPYLPNLVLWMLSTGAAALYAQYVGATLLHHAGAAVGLSFVLLFCTLASNLSSDMNGINYFSLSERLLARFACGLYYAALATAMTFGDAPSYVICVLAGAAAALSSLFSRQAVFFATPLVALITLDVTPILMMGLAAFAAFAVDGRYFTRGIRHMIGFSHQYNLRTKHSRYYKSGLSRFADWRLLLRRGVALGVRLHEMESHEPTRVAFRYPELILLLGLWLFLDIHIAPAVIALIAATLIVYVVTSTQRFRHLGEANRYIEYNLFVLLPLTLATAASENEVPAVIWVAYAAWLAFVIWRQWRRWSHLRYPDHDRLKELLAPLRLEPTDTAFTVPMSLGAAVCARATCRALMYQGVAFTLELYDKFLEEAPFLKRDWKKLAREFDVTHIVAEKSYLVVMKDLVGWEYDFTGLPVLAESDAYIVYAAAEAQGTAVP
jgi:hypothetical protein